MASFDIIGSGFGNELQNLLASNDEIEPGHSPSYQLCKVIYEYHPLGAKMAESPIAMAQFKPREVEVPAGPDLVKEAFIKEWNRIGADRQIFNLAKLARVYGVCSISLLEEDVPTTKPVDFRHLPNSEMAFNIFDPLNTAGSLVLSQDPTSMAFLKPTDISVSGMDYHRSRTCTLLNEEPIFLGWTTSAFGYVGRSVYQRALFPLKSFLQTMLTDDMVSVKAGVLITKMKSPGSIVDNLMQGLAAAKRLVVKMSTVGNVISILPDEEVESLNLQNLDGAFGNSRKNILENIAVAADMPAKLLNAETFAEGFGEGTEDAKNVARYVDRIRTWMEPAYDYFTKIVMYRAWNEEFYHSIQQQYPDSYGSKDFKQAFYEWKNSFIAPWPSLLTEPESERVKTDDVLLKAAISLWEVLAPSLDPENKAMMTEWLAANVNDRKLLFTTPLELNYESLAEYTPAAPMEEPHEPRPFAAQDSVVRQLRSAQSQTASDVDELRRLVLQRRTRR